MDFSDIKNAISDLYDARSLRVRPTIQKGVELLTGTVLSDDQLRSYLRNGSSADVQP